MNREHEAAIETMNAYAEAADAAADEISQLKEQLAQATKENTLLRGLLPKLAAPCAYCGKTNMADCPHGFPGCPQADDLMCADDETFKRMLDERNAARSERDIANGCLAHTQDALEACERASGFVAKDTPLPVHIWQVVKERDAARDVAQWAQAALTALNVGDVDSGSLLHLKLREVMIAYRAELARLESLQKGETK
jgi:hypothetical protein